MYVFEFCGKVLIYLIVNIQPGNEWDVGYCKVHRSVTYLRILESGNRYIGIRI